MDNGEFAEIKAKIREEHPEVPWVDVCTEPIWYGRNPRTILDNPIDGRFAVVGSPHDDPADERVFCVASTQYQIVRPELAVHQFKEALRGFREYGEPKITIRSFGDGAKWFAEAIFPVTVNVNGRDISPKAGQKNSLDLGWEYSNWFGAYDYICTNGMVAGHLELMSKKKHRLNLDICDQTAKLTKGMHSMSEQFLIWEGWAQKKLNQAATETFLEAVPAITENQCEKILELPIRGEDRSMNDLLLKDKANVWLLHAAVTQYYTHEVVESVSRIEREDKIAHQFNQAAMKLAA